MLRLRFIKRRRRECVSKLDKDAFLRDPTMMQQQCLIFEGIMECVEASSNCSWNKRRRQVIAFLAKIPTCCKANWT